MAESIPLDHPRRQSLLEREVIFEAFREGLLAPVATIAHGRGEAFDYLLGEKTTPSAKGAIQLAAKILLKATKPVISVNGNTAVLARKDLWRLAKRLNCPIEVNIFYRTPQRMKLLLDYLRCEGVVILGENADALIPNLSSERSKCSSEGIYKSDVVFVPLEDGDRCEALRKMGKEVITVDLNPFSRTARTASLTIVDNITRCVKMLADEVERLKVEGWDSDSFDTGQVDNGKILAGAVEDIQNRLEEFKKRPLVKP